MLEAAKEAGYEDVSKRLLLDWTNLGLLDTPERKSRGPGGGSGSRFEFADHQLELFLALLQQRKGLRYVAGLASLPVSAWLYWGDEWVPLRQVRKALMTWWGRGGHVQSLAKTRELAQRFVDVLVGDQGSKAKRKRLVDEITSSFDAKHYDVAKITQLVEDVLASLPGGHWGPFQMGTQEAVDLLRAMTVAMEHYDEFSDGAFYEARARLRQNAVAYFRDQPKMADDRVWGHLFNEMSFQDLVNRACADLLIGLGFMRIAIDYGRQLPPVELQQWTRPPAEFLKRIT